MKNTVRLWWLCFLLSSPLSAWAQNQDFREETIYFLITSRFFDGDSTNNAPNEWCSYIEGVNNPNITDPKDVTWRGDFKGLIQKLDYIKDLGFTAIWITPIVHNRSPLDYHGYHAWDFMRVDPRLESPGATFKDLIDAAHAKGIKVILDIVTNHSGRFGIKGQSELKYNTNPNAPWYAAPNPDWEYDGLTPNPQDGKRWSRANLATMPPPYNQNLANFNWPCTESFVNTSDPNWFHRSGNGFAQGWDDTTNLYQRALADDCPDLNTGSAVVRQYMFQAYKRFIDMGVDGFRWDTWKHMNKGDIFVLLDSFRRVKPDLFVVGEVAQKRHELHQVEEINPHWYTWRGAVGQSPSANVSVLDFYAEATFHNIFQDGGGFSGVQAAARYDHLYSDPSQLVTWLDNHDFGPNNDWNQRYGGSDENLAACMNFMFTWRGIPSVYYGTESRFKSGFYTDLHNSAGTQKSLNETGRAYFGDVIDNAPNHRIYKHIRKLNAIRRAIPALQKGSWRWAGNFPGNGIGYWREFGDSKVAVGLAKDGSASFSFSVPNGVYRDAVTGRSVSVSNGTLNFSVASGSAGIYVLNGPGMIGESGAGFFEACAEGCATGPAVRISPSSGNYSAPIQVSMAVSGGTGPYNIRYTLDGSTPTANSLRYSGPFSVAQAAVVRAIAIDATGRIAPVEAQRYTFVPPAPTVSVSPNGGNAYDPITVRLTPSGGTGPYAVFYTLDGSTPTVGSAVYTAPFTLSQAATLKVLVRDAIGTLSAVVTKSFTFNIPAPIITTGLPVGNYVAFPQTVTLTATSPRPPVRIYYTTDGTEPTESSAVYSTPLSIGSQNASVAVRVLAIDNIGQRTQARFNYTFNPIPDIWIYFKKPSNWSNNIRIHYWNCQPAGVYTNTTWPGVAMTKHCGDWYKFRFSGVSFVNIVINDGAGKQTADLNRRESGYFDNGSWLSTPPSLPTEPNLSVAPAGPFNSNRPFDVNINASVCTGQPVFFYTLDGTEPTLNSSQMANNFTLNVDRNTTLKLFARDENGQVSPTQTHVYTLTTTALPTPTVGYVLYQNKPNPADSETSIEFEAAEAAAFTLTVYNAQGMAVAHLNGQSQTGRNAVLLSVADWPAGMYIYELKMPYFKAARKMVIGH